MNLKNNLDCCHQDKHKFIIVLVTILSVFLVVLTLSSFVDIINKIKEGKYIGQEIETKNTITVAGEGEVYAKPDLALTSFSVVTDKKTVELAMEENTVKMNKIIGEMKDLGIKENDLKTTSFNIYPRYEYKRDSSIYSSGQRVLVGYEVTQTLQVKIRDMEIIGEVIQKATDAGSNQVGNLQFTIDDQDKFKKEARAEAVEQAREKAEEIADALGVNLVRVTNFNENLVTPRLATYDFAMKEAVGMGGGGEAPGIETGENKIGIVVSVTYEIN